MIKQKRYIGILLGQEALSYKERLDGLGLFSLERGRLGDGLCNIKVVYIRQMAYFPGQVGSGRGKFKNTMFKRYLDKRMDSLKGYIQTQD